MNKVNRSTYVAGVVVLGLLFPSYAAAGWRDKSGDLDFGSSAGIGLAALAAVGVVTWLVLRNRGESADTTDLAHALVDGSATESGRRSPLRFRVGGAYDSGSMSETNSFDQRVVNDFGRSASNLVEVRIEF